MVESSKLSVVVPSPGREERTAVWIRTAVGVRASKQREFQADFAKTAAMRSKVGSSRTKKTAESVAMTHVTRGAGRIQPLERARPRDRVLGIGGTEQARGLEGRGQVRRPARAAFRVALNE